MRSDVVISEECFVKILQVKGKEKKGEDIFFFPLLLFFSFLFFSFWLDFVCLFVCLLARCQSRSNWQMQRNSILLMKGVGECVCRTKLSESSWLMWIDSLVPGCSLDLSSLDFLGTLAYFPFFYFEFEVIYLLFLNFFRTIFKFFLIMYIIEEVSNQFRVAQ